MVRVMRVMRVVELRVVVLRVMVLRVVVLRVMVLRVMMHVVRGLRGQRDARARGLLQPREEVRVQRLRDGAVERVVRARDGVRHRVAHLARPERKVLARDEARPREDERAGDGERAPVGVRDAERGGRHAEHCRERAQRERR